MVEPSPASAGGEPSRTRPAGAARYTAAALVAVALAVLIAGAQAIGFYAHYSPRLAEAGERLRDLRIETAERRSYRQAASGVQRLAKSGAASASLNDAWRRFESRFTVDPEDAIAELSATLQGYEAFETTGGLRDALARLKTIYADPYEPLLEALAHPPMYLRPVAGALADISGYRRAAKLNRALHLASVGEIGTAHVVLSGLQASTSDPAMLGKLYFMLGRLQFEMYRARPRPEYRLRAIDYLRQSLRADPAPDLARRFLDYLLSLERRATATMTLQGAPTSSSSDNEGTVVPEGERRF